jgi:hypothetical protein
LSGREQRQRWSKTVRTSYKMATLLQAKHSGSFSFKWGCFSRSSCNMPILGMDAQNWYFAFGLVSPKFPRWR